MVTREPEWDDQALADLLELVAYEGETCDGCGTHKALAEDPDIAVDFADHVCPVCQAIEVHDREQAEADEAEEKRLGEKPAADVIRASDGRHTFVRFTGSAT